MAESAQELIEAATAARARVLACLARVDLARPGLVGEWSGREVVAHLGYWAGYAVEVIHAAENGRQHEVGLNRPPVDEINATAARVARDSDLAAVVAREGAAFDALVDRLRNLPDAAVLDLPLRGGATVRDAVREDAVEHYADHAAELEAKLA